jgi:hypothetical protein
MALVGTVLGLGAGISQAVRAEGNAGLTSGSPDAEYVGGTIKSLAPKIAGTLDLKDPSDLQFRYTVDKFRLHYADIRTFSFSAPAQRHLVAHVPVPRVPFQKHDQILDISFREQDGTLGNASFRVSAGSRAFLESRLNERIEAEKKTDGSPATRTKLPESWWGDKYWKTNRNKAGWSGQPGVDAPAAGSK